METHCSSTFCVAHFYINQISLSSQDDVLDTEHFPLTKLEVLENVKLGDFCVARMRPDQTFGRSGFVRLIYPENSVTRSRCFKLHMVRFRCYTSRLRNIRKKCTCIRAYFFTFYCTQYLIRNVQYVQMSYILSPRMRRNSSQSFSCLYVIALIFGAALLKATDNRWHLFC